MDLSCRMFAHSLGPAAAMKSWFLRQPHWNHTRWRLKYSFFLLQTLKPLPPYSFPPQTTWLVLHSMMSNWLLFLFLTKREVWHEPAPHLASNRAYPCFSHSGKTSQLALKKERKKNQFPSCNMPLQPLLRVRKYNHHHVMMMTRRWRKKKRRGW